MFAFSFDDVDFTNMVGWWMMFSESASDPLGLREWDAISTSTSLLLYGCQCYRGETQARSRGLYCRKAPV